MTDIRSRFKGANLSVQRKAKEDAEKKSKSSFSGDGSYTGYLKIEEGANVFRIAPPHEEDSPSYRPFRTAWLECDLPVLDEDGKETGKREVRTKRVFSASVHQKQNVDGSIPKDVVETYINYVYQRANDEYQDKDEKATFLAPITGATIKGKWQPGIRPSTNYMFYAWKGGELGRIEMYPSILKRMDELNAAAEDPDQMMEIDIFSDPDNGVSLIIDYDKKAGRGEKYKVSKKEYDFGKFLERANGDKDKAIKYWQEAKESEKISDVQLKELSEKKSLKELYVDVYSKKDFDLALNGLAIFDEKHKYGIFENEEFLAELQEIESLVPEKTEKKTSKDGDDIEDTVKGHEQKIANDTSKWPKPKCNAYLKNYILDAYDGEKELPTDLSLSDLRKWCDLAIAGEELPFEDVEEETDEQQYYEQEQEEEEQQEETPPQITQSAAEKIAALRKRAGK